MNTMRSMHLLSVLLTTTIAGLVLWPSPQLGATSTTKGSPAPSVSTSTQERLDLLNGPSPLASSDNPRYTPVVDLVRRVRNAVVNIHSERSVKAGMGEELFALAPSQNRVNGMGTGIVLDPRGYIITNHHVVEDVSSLRVRLADATTVPARVVARDAENDLALLKVEVDRPLPVIPLGTATDLMVGETVVAIGNAYGYDHTVTVGVVSAIKRDVILNKEISYKGLIQTDASINPGNSGGPLLNIKGELVGVNVAIRAGAQGIGFAIPVDTMLKVAADLMSAKRMAGLSHGVTGRDRVTTLGGRIVSRELIVESVDDNSPAARAGLQRGDVIVRLAGQDIACRLDLERQLFDRKAGERLGLSVRRGNAEQQLEMMLESVTELTSNVPSESSDLVWRRLGLRVQKVGSEAVARANRQLHGGLSVEDVRPDSSAARAGLQRGDVLVGLHQWEMLSMENLVYVLTHPDLATFNPLRFYIIRSGQVHRGWLQAQD